MAKRKPKATNPKTEVSESIELTDLTSENIDELLELPEIEITEIESLIENGDNLTLIEEEVKKKGDDECDQPQEEETASKENLEKQDLNQDKQEITDALKSKKDSEELAQKNLNEIDSTNSKGSGIKTVTPSKVIKGTSVVGSKKAGRIPGANTTLPEEKNVKVKIAKKRVHKIEPKKSNDGLTRTTFGLFSR